MTSSSFSSVLAPTLEGYFVYDAQDALAIIQLVLEGKLTIAHRRPKDQERPYVIRSGNVFVFKEMKGHIQRWTDGVTWSASRILMPFLVYRENTKVSLKGSDSGNTRSKNDSSTSISNRSMKSSQATRSSKSRKTYSVESLPSPMSLGMGQQASSSRDFGAPEGYYQSNAYYSQGAQAMTMMPRSTQSYSQPPQSQYLSSPHNSTFSESGLKSRDPDYDLFGSLKDAHFAEDGLAKKTISVKYQGVPYRLISYFTKPDVMQGKLKRPSTEDMFRNVVIEKELWEGVDRVKAPLDMPEVYFSSGQFSSSNQMSSYPGYPPPQMSMGGYHQDMSMQPPYLSESIYSEPGGRIGGAGGKVTPSAHPAINYDAGQQYNVYSQGATGAAAVTAPVPPPPPQTWYQDSTHGYRVAGIVPYGSTAVKPEGFAPGTFHSHDVNRETGSAASPDDRSITDAYMRGGFSTSSAYDHHTMNASSTPSTANVYVSSSHTHASRVASRRNSSIDSGPSSGPRGIRIRQGDRRSDPSEVGNRSDPIPIPGSNALPQSIEVSPQLGQHQDLLPSMGSESSPLEPAMRSGISASTFISPGYDYDESESAKNTTAPNATHIPQSDEQTPRPVDFRPQYSASSLSPPPAAQSKAGPSIYLSTGRAWN